MTSRLPPSLKLLEITVLSAQDLAPVSKLLRTYAVAWVDPDQKLTTRVDHHGNTNPTWNYRFIFRVDDSFLNSDTSTITFEIYNVSWLRDIPIGTVQTTINNIVPPSVRSQKNSTTRYVSLQLRRPSGALQGRINLGVNLIDGTRKSMPLDSELSASTDDNSSNNKISDTNNNSSKLSRSESEGSMSRPLMGGPAASKTGSIFSGVSIFERLKRAKSAKIMDTPITLSSVKMRPLPSEVVATMAKGFYSATDDIGSSVFENWTLSGNERSREGTKQNVVAKAEVVMEQKQDKFGPTSKPRPLQLQKKVVKKKTDRGGLLSCFGLSCGFECLCRGHKSKKNLKVGIGTSKMFSNKHPEERYRQIHR